MTAMSSRDSKNTCDNGILRIFRRSVHDLGSLMTAASNSPHKVRPTDKLPYNAQKTVLSEVTNMDSNTENGVFLGRKASRQPLRLTASDKSTLSDRQDSISALANSKSGGKLKGLFNTKCYVVESTGNNQVEHAPTSAASCPVEDWSLDSLQVSQACEFTVDFTHTLSINKDEKSQCNSEVNMCVNNMSSVTKGLQEGEKGSIFNTGQTSNLVSLNLNKSAEDWSDELETIPLECSNKGIHQIEDSTSQPNDLLYCELEKCHHSTPKKSTSRNLTEEMLPTRCLCMSTMELNSVSNSCLSARKTISADDKCVQELCAEIIERTIGCDYPNDNQLLTGLDSNIDKVVVAQETDNSTLEDYDDSIISVGEIPNVPYVPEVSDEKTYLIHNGDDFNIEETPQICSVHIPLKLQGLEVYSDKFVGKRQHKENDDHATESLICLEKLEDYVEKEEKVAADIWEDEVGNNDDQNADQNDRLTEGVKKSPGTNITNTMDTNNNSPITECNNMSSSHQFNTAVIFSPSGRGRKKSRDNNIPPRFRKATSPKVFSSPSLCRQTSVFHGHPRKLSENVHHTQNELHGHRQPYKITPSPWRGNTANSHSYCKANPSRNVSEREPVRVNKRPEFGHQSDQYFYNSSVKDKCKKIDAEHNNARKINCKTNAENEIMKALPKGKVDSHVQQKSLGSGQKSKPVESAKLCKGGFPVHEQYVSNKSSSCAVGVHEKYNNVTPSKDNSFLSSHRRVTPLMDRRINTPEQYKFRPHNSQTCTDNRTGAHNSRDSTRPTYNIPVSENWNCEVVEVPISDDITGICNDSVALNKDQSEETQTLCTNVSPDEYSLNLTSQCMPVSQFPDKKMQSPPSESQPVKPYLPPTPEKDLELICETIHTNNGGIVMQDKILYALPGNDINLNIGEPLTESTPRQFLELVIDAGTIDTNRNQCCMYLPPSPDEANYSLSPVEVHVTGSHAAVDNSQGVEQESVDHNNKAIVLLDEECISESSLLLKAFTNEDKVLQLETCMEDTHVREVPKTDGLEMNTRTIVSNKRAESELNKLEVNVDSRTRIFNKEKESINIPNTCHDFDNVNEKDAAQSLMTTINKGSDMNAKESVKTVYDNGCVQQKIDVLNNRYSNEQAKSKLAIQKSNDLKNSHSNLNDTGAHKLSDHGYEYFMNNDFQRYLQYEHWYRQQSQELSLKHNCYSYPWGSPDSPDSSPEDYNNLYMKQCFDYFQLDPNTVPQYYQHCLPKLDQPFPVDGKVASETCEIVSDAENNIGENISAFWAERLPYWVQCQADEKELKHRHQPVSQSGSETTLKQLHITEDTVRHIQSKPEGSSSKNETEIEAETSSVILPRKVDKQEHNHVTDGFHVGNTLDDIVVDICDSNLEEIDVSDEQQDNTVAALEMSNKTGKQNMQPSTEQVERVEALVKDEVLSEAWHEEVGTEEDDRPMPKVRQPCTCDKDVVQYWVWRTCRCEAGLWPCIQDVIPISSDDRSVDLGYQSYDSIDESTVVRLKSRSSVSSQEQQSERKANVTCHQDLNANVPKPRTCAHSTFTLDKTDLMKNTELNSADSFKHILSKKYINNKPETFSSQQPNFFVSRGPTGCNPHVYMVNDHLGLSGQKCDSCLPNPEQRRMTTNIQDNRVTVGPTRNMNSDSNETGNMNTSIESANIGSNLRHIVNTLQQRNVLASVEIPANVDTNSNLVPTNTDCSTVSGQRHTPHKLDTSVELDTITEEGTNKHGGPGSNVDLNANITFGVTENTAVSQRVAPTRRRPNSTSERSIEEINTDPRCSRRNQMTTETKPGQLWQNVPEIDNSQLPECVQKSAKHLAEADSGLCKAEETRTTLNKALKTISQAIFDYGKNLEVSNEHETASSCKTQNVAVGRKASKSQCTLKADTNNNCSDLQYELKMVTEFPEIADTNEKCAELREKLKTKGELKSIMKPVKQCTKLSAREILTSSTDTDVVSETSESSFGILLSQSPNDSEDHEILDHEIVSGSESENYSRRGVHGLHSLSSPERPDIDPHPGFYSTMPGFDQYRFGMEYPHSQFKPRFSTRSPLMNSALPFRYNMPQAEGSNKVPKMPRKSDNEFVTSWKPAERPESGQSAPCLPVYPPPWTMRMYPPWYPGPPGPAMRHRYMDGSPAGGAAPSGQDRRKTIPCNDVQPHSPYSPWVNVASSPPQSTTVCESKSTPVTKNAGNTMSTNSVDNSSVNCTEPAMKQAVKLVEYGLSDAESDSEIEQFDFNRLSNERKEAEPKPKTSTVYRESSIQHTPKRLKCSSSDNESSEDSFLTDSARKQMNFSVRGTLSRKPSKKLNQKSLKSFTSQEWKPPTVKDTSKSTATQSAAARTSNVAGDKENVKPPARRKTLAEVLAASKDSTMSGTEADCDTDVEVRGLSQDFPPLYSKKDLPPLPPLPPFPASPFWGMYLTNSNSALTGKTATEKFYSPTETAKATTQQRVQDSKSPVGRYTRRSWSPAGAIYSPGHRSLVSPSDASSDSPSIRSDWKAQFRQFNSFGVKYIDTHCHLDFLFSRENFRGNFKSYREENPELFPDTFEGCVAVFCNPATFNPDYGLWRQVSEEDNVWFAMGCHPKMALDFTPTAERGLRKCLTHKKCVALGEIGLDYSGTFWQHKEMQKNVFRHHLDIAMEMEKPLVIHCRDAEDDCLTILKEMVPRQYKIHCHCFTGSWYNAQKWIDAFPNLYVGLTPLVTYRTATPSHDLAKNVPLNKLLLETDAPYFIPRSIPKDELQFSNPGLAVTVAKEVAQYQELPVAAVLRQCRLNTKFMYGI